MLAGECLGFHAVGVDVELQQQVGEVCRHALEELLAGGVFVVHGSEFSRTRDAE